MHVLHVIAVEADSAEEAIDEARDGIEPYGQGDVWDWYAIGGRWDGVFGGANTVNFATNSEAFKAALERVENNQNQEFREVLDTVTGREVKPEDVPDHVFGLPVEDKEQVAKNITVTNLATHECWKKLKAMTTLPRGDRDLCSLGYHLQKLGKLVSGIYTFDSYFYDVAWGGTQIDAVQERCENDPEKQWLVAIDLHN